MLVCIHCDCGRNVWGWLVAPSPLGWLPLTPPATPCVALFRRVPVDVDAAVEAYLLNRALLQCALGMLTPQGEEARSRHAVAQELLSSALLSTALSRANEMAAIRAGVTSSQLLAAVHNHCIVTAVCDAVLPLIDNELDAAEQRAVVEDAPG